MGVEAEPLLDGHHHHDAEQTIGLKDDVHFSRKSSSRRQWSLWLTSTLTHVLVMLLVLVAINFVPHARTVLILGETPRPMLYCMWTCLYIYMFVCVCVYMCSDK